MLDDVKEALAAEKLDCRPIKGHDYPLSRSGLSSQKKVGLGGAEIVEVMNMDKFEEPLKHSDSSCSYGILEMLLPNQLKAPEMVFIEEDDIADEDQLRASCQGLPTAPLTGF